MLTIHRARVIFSKGPLGDFETVLYYDGGVAGWATSIARRFVPKLSVEVSR
jgi:3-phosphoglycerate kinase